MSNGLKAAFCCWVAAVTLVGTPDSASAEGKRQEDVSVYVSDQFKTVTKRVFVQLSSDSLKNACRKPDTACERVMKSLTLAVSAAAAQDHTALSGALNEFFVESSIAAGLDLVLGKLLHADMDPQWAQGLNPLVDCVAASLVGTSRSEACRFEQTAGYVTTLFDHAIRGEELGVADRESLVRAWKQLYENHRMDAELALRALAAFATAKSIDHPELRVYLLSLSEWARYGSAEGLFASTYQYLVNLDGSVTELTAVADILDGDPTRYGFWNPARDPTTASQLQGCSEAAAAFKTWTIARDQGAISAWRKAILQGGRVDLSMFQPLERIRSCPSDASEVQLRKLQKAIRYQRGAVDVHRTVTEYGVGILAAAMLIDYVRTSDERQLARQLRAVLLYGSSRATLHVLNRDTPSKPAFSSVRDVLRSCEYQSIAIRLGLQPIRNLTHPEICIRLKDAESEAAPGESAIAANAEEERSALRALELESRRDSNAATGASGSDLSVVIERLQRGEGAAATRMVLRQGIDLLVQRVDEFSAKVLDVTPESCARDARSRSIFTGLGAGCAAHLFIQAAYHPIADWYWEQGANRDDTAKVAASVYRNMLASPYLDTTPVILNVGVGGNYIAGSRAIWGEHGYGALTVIDKLGLAFYKHSAPDFRWETGPFVGGFLDALVRTASNSGESQRYWLAGYTLGSTRTWSTDIGFELHVAAAMPFSFSDTSRYGLTVGGALIVPFNSVLQEE